MPVKIAIIGAGSAVFSLRLLIDLCLTPNLAGSTIHFMDIDKSRLDAVHKLCSRYADEVGTKFTLKKTTNRREALEGADFVINTALAAGHERLQAGWEIGRQYGYRIGGSLHIMHDEGFWINFYQLKLMDSVIRDVLEVCAEAWYLQVGNPVLAGITHMGREYPQAKIIGLCHGFSAIYYIASKLGLEREQITFEIPGVNHFVWLTHFYYKGQDAFPLLDKWIETEGPKHWETCNPGDALGPLAVDLYRRFGVYPIGDTGTPGGGSWPYWYHSDDETESRWNEKPQQWYADYFEYLTRTVARIQHVGDDISARVTETYPPKTSGEVMVPIIESIACDIPRVVIGNILNKGSFVPGVPSNFAVEIPTLVSQRGVQGIQTEGLPRALTTYILRDYVAPIEIELEAYKTGSKELLLQLILMDPYTKSEKQAQALLDEILALPFHDAIRKHYC
jgi:alpha-galactosidase